MCPNMYLEFLIKQREKIIVQIAAAKKLDTARVSNKNMFKREILETTIKGK